MWTTHTAGVPQVSLRIPSTFFFFFFVSWLEWGRGSSEAEGRGRRFDTGLARKFYQEVTRGRLDTDLKAGWQQFDASNASLLKEKEMRRK